jgi:PAS domain S-box-containing protein
MCAISKEEILERVLEAMAGVLITDEQGRIVYLNDAYTKIIGLSREEVIGKLATDIVPGSRMHIVAKTGQEEIGSIFKLKNGESILVNRLPIKKDGKIIGAIAFSTINAKDSLSTQNTITNVRRLTQELNQYKNDLNKLRGAKYSLDMIIGRSPSIDKVKTLIEKVAQTKSTVLITGETGTGKEFVAHAIHQSSSRSHQPFIRVNCAAIPADLLEAELFGFEEGSFTGAKKGGKLGKFELANNGTLLLDEINSMPLQLQPKLVRIIQEKELERIGGTKSIDVDVRLICTTNQDLYQMVENGEFRSDLFYRINVMTIDTPPLRARHEDIPVLVEHFISKINKELGLNINGIDEDVIALFCSYNWPGNIRELEHSIERAANIVLSGKLSIEHFENLCLRMESENSKQKDAGLASARAKAEKHAILEALALTNNNVTKASAILNIHRTVLYDKMKKFGIKI